LAPKAIILLIFWSATSKFFKKIAAAGIFLRIFAPQAKLFIISAPQPKNLEGISAPQAKFLEVDEQKTGPQK
jgi:hypothetical protein